MAGLIALALAYTLSQFYRSFLAVLTPTLTAELGMSNTELSLASGVWFLTFALMQFAIGPSLDRFGPRRTAAVLLALGGGGGALLFAAAWSPGMIILSMSLIGIGCAPLLVASLFIFAHIYSPARFATLASWFIALGNGGNILGAAPMAASVQFFGWRGSMTMLALISLAVAVSVWTLVKDPQRAEEEGDSGGLAGYLELLRMPVLWGIIPLIAVHYAPAATIRGMWAGPYLAEVYGANALTIGNVTFLMAVAMVAGSIAYGPLDAILKTRKWLAFGGSCTVLVLLAVLWASPSPPFMLACGLLIAVGVFGMGYGVIMAHARAFFPPHLTGRGVTLMTFFSMGSVGLVQFATGAVFRAAEDPSAPATAYSALFGFYALLLATGLVLYFFSRDAKPGIAA